MATDKKFTVAGISKLEGTYKVRFANDMMRIKVLAKSGHEDIRLADLEGEYTKLEAAQILQWLKVLSLSTLKTTLLRLRQLLLLRSRPSPLLARLLPRLKQLR